MKNIIIIVLLLNVWLYACHGGQDREELIITDADTLVSSSGIIWKNYLSSSLQLLKDSVWSDQKGRSFFVQSPRLYISPGINRNVYVGAIVTRKFNAFPCVDGSDRCLVSSRHFSLLFIILSLQLFVHGKIAQRPNQYGGKHDNTSHFFQVLLAFTPHMPYGRSQGWHPIRGQFHHERHFLPVEKYPFKQLGHHDSSQNSKQVYPKEN